jgi:hypothetical protein
MFLGQKHYFYGIHIKGNVQNIDNVDISLKLLFSHIETTKIQPMKIILYYFHHYLLEKTGQ